MKTITVIYSPLCETNGSFIQNLYDWLYNQDIEIEVYPFNLAPDEYKALITSEGNCFIDVFYNSQKIDTVPLHREHLLEVLGISENKVSIIDPTLNSVTQFYLQEDFRKLIFLNKINFIPITKDTYHEEMSMCLCNYPMGNPPKEHHQMCISIKEQIFNEVWEKEKIAGIYAKLDRTVIGLLEVLPREIVRKHGFMTGSQGRDSERLTVTCYEIALGIPRTLIIDELMYQFLKISDSFSRKIVEGIGIYEWNSGFNPYWVYEKYGFIKREQMRENVIVMEKII